MCDYYCRVYCCYIITSIVAYFIGSIPFGYIIGKIVKGVDIRTLGSGNIGATNVARVIGLPWGILCLLLDAAKGFIPTLYVLLHSGQIINITLQSPDDIWGEVDITLASIIGLAIIVGHLYPVYLRFKGGKGVATSLGVFMAMAVIPFFTNMLIVAITIWIVFFVSLRYVSLASIMAAVSLPLYFYFLMDTLPYFITCDYDCPYPLLTFFVCVIISVLIIIRHIPNIKRLIKGTEPKVSVWRTKEQKN